MGKIMFRLALAGFITIIVFMLGFLLGYQLFQGKLSEIQDTQNSIQADTLSIDIESQLASESACDAKSLEALAMKMETLGPKIDMLEKQSGHLELEGLKKYYALLEIKHWLAIKSMNSRCGTDYLPVLYFYSNTNCKDCGEQGAVLLHQKTLNPKLMIYSFDIDSDLSAIKILKSRYAIENVPAIIVREQRFEGLLSADDLSRIMK